MEYFYIACVICVCIWVGQIIDRKVKKCAPEEDTEAQQEIAVLEERLAAKEKLIEFLDSRVQANSERYTKAEDRLASLQKEFSALAARAIDLNQFKDGLQDARKELRNDRQNK